MFFAFDVIVDEQLVSGRHSREEQFSYGSYLFWWPDMDISHPKGT